MNKELELKCPFSFNYKEWYDHRDEDHYNNFYAVGCIKEECAIYNVKLQQCSLRKE